MMPTATDPITLERAVARLAERDATLFADPAIAADRLGWIGLPDAALASADELDAFAAQQRTAGITDVVLLGMGGSSLAPLVLSRVLGSQAGFARLHVLDTTLPLAVTRVMEALRPASTLVLVSSKSGTTIEPLSLADVFLDWMQKDLGHEAGSHFIGITDPGSPLEGFASERGFARVFHAQADIGGRFAALSTFATVPAALIGADVSELAAFGAAAETSCSRPGDENPAAALAAWIASAYDEGRDKLTLVCSQELAPFGLWVEQLVAESSGKRGGGILPVLETYPGIPEAHGSDRMTFVLRTEEDEVLASLPDRLPDDEPVFESVIEDRYALGAQFVLWEWGVALACALTGIEPFDQPDVEEAKREARRIVGGGSVTCSPSLRDGDLSVTSTLPMEPQNLREALAMLLDEATQKPYLAVLAYLPEDEQLLAPLRAACDRLSAARQLPVTFELGPRYLHSTGQYHKGGSDRGLYLFVTAQEPVDLNIPGASFTLGQLSRAQAAADASTLAGHIRPVVTVELPTVDNEHIRTLAEALESLS
jgi:glucose-6-phosphate isomerase/transaldolase/glucose-6-phosphate isomerase